MPLRECSVAAADPLQPGQASWQSTAPPAAPRRQPALPAVCPGPKTACQGCVMHLVCYDGQQAERLHPKLQRAARQSRCACETVV